MKLVYKYISLILLALLLTPSVIQLTHVIAEEHHDVEICHSKDEQHYHDHEVECELCKFHLNDFSTDVATSLPEITFIEITSTNHFFYSFKSEQNTSFHLRGPPSLT